MDIATIVGILLGFMVVISAIVAGGVMLALAT